MKIFVLLENEQPVGVTRSKTRAESWIFSMKNDYAGPFELEEPDTSSPRAPEEAHGATPAQNLMRNLETVDKNLSKADEDLKKEVEKLQKNLRKRFNIKSSLLQKGDQHERSRGRE